MSDCSQHYIMSPTAPLALSLALAATSVAALEPDITFDQPRDQPWDVAISRRPYITEETGELLVQLDPALLGGHVEITADLPCAQASWNWTLATTPGSEQYILPFSLTSLPKLLNNDMHITVVNHGVHVAVATSTKRRRFQRAWKPNSTNTVQVDHSTRGLLVNGEPWAMMGWYIYDANSLGWEGALGGPCDTNSTSFPKQGDPRFVKRTAECTRWGIGNMTAEVAAMGDRGITAVMPYHFDPYEPKGIAGLPVEELESLILTYFDVAHAHGVKVMVHMANLRFDRHPYTNVTLSAIERNVALVKDHPALLAYYLCDDCGPGVKMAPAYNTIRKLDPFHLTVGAGFARNKGQYTDSQISADGQLKLDTLPMLPSITCTAAQGAQPPTPCETKDSKDKDACDRTKNPTGEGCCIECGDLDTIKPVTGLSLDIIMIENYSPSMDSHAKSDGGALREGVPWQAMVNCDGSYKLEEHITPHKSPRVLQTLMWIAAIAAGTPHQLVFVGTRPIPMGAIPWGGAGSHPESSFWGSKVSMPLYAAVEMYAAQMRVMLPSISAPFGLPQPSVAVLRHTILVPPTGVTGWKVGETLSARAWRQAPGLVTGGNSTYCGHIVVANGAEQSSQAFTLRLGGSFPVNTTWWSMRVVRMFDADYAITVSADGTFSDYIDAASHNVYQIGDCGDEAPPPPSPVCTPDKSPLGCYDVSHAGCIDHAEHTMSEGSHHDPNHGCLWLPKSSCSDLSKKLTKANCAAACQHWAPKGKAEPREYDVAGVLDGKLCFCGMSAQIGLNASLKRQFGECQATPCSGNASTMCGAPDRLLVYNYTTMVPASPWEPH